MKRQFRRVHRRPREGFTLLEVMLVLVIIAAIAGIAVYNIGGLQGKAYAMTAKNQISVFKSALEQYKLFVGSYPADLQALHAQPNDVDATKYTQVLKDAIPNDPWGKPYEYKLNGAAYELRSLGADGQSGTEDDISS